MTPSFRVEILHLDGGVAVALIGELDLSGVDGLGVVRALSGRYDLGQVTLWCSHLEFIDATGLDALRAALSHFGPEGRPTLMDPPAVLTVLLETTGNEDFELGSASSDQASPPAGWLPLA